VIGDMVCEQPSGFHAEPIHGFVYGRNLVGKAPGSQLTFSFNGLAQL
jgi:hypothetical protein